VLYGAFAERLGSLARAFLVLCAVLPVASAVTLAAPSTLGMLVLVPIAGVVIAPLQATQNQLVGLVAPSGTITEAYTWVLMGLVVGISVGNAAAGALVDASGWRAAIAVGCVPAALGAFVAWARRGTLRPAAVVA
jgi:MFS family permease